MPKAHVIVYSRPGCHLCEEAKKIMRDANCDDLFMLEEFNIESDPSILARYQYDIPVITINGVETFIHRIKADEFRRALSRAATQE